MRLSLDYGMGDSIAPEKLAFRFFDFDYRLEGLEAFRYTPSGFKWKVCFLICFWVGDLPILDIFLLGVPDIDIVFGLLRFILGLEFELLLDCLKESRSWLTLLLPKSIREGVFCYNS